MLQRLWRALGIPTGLGRQFRGDRTSCCPHGTVLYSRTDVGNTDVSPHTYHSGRWLVRDAERQEARNIRFDFDALVDKAIGCAAGAKRVQQCVKIEGSFNRAFVLKLDTGASVVARIPFPHAGPRRLTTHSEVATLRYSKPNSPRCYRRH